LSTTTIPPVGVPQARLDLEQAHRMFAAGLASVQKAGYISDVINGTNALADIRLAQGRLHEAMRTREQALRLALEQSEPAPRGTADVYVGLSELHRERDDLDRATQLLLTSQELSERTGFPYNRSRWCVAMARIREARGDPDGALDLFDEAERRYVPDFFPNVRPVAALRARVWIAQGRVGEAAGWAREQRLSTEDELGYVREFEHMTLARLLLAQSGSDRGDLSIHAATRLLERLRQAATEGERAGSLIEILVMESLAHQTRGDGNVVNQHINRHM
jgi:LuxR family transcriptional regulator, maltose regulon positive regulatory protein